MNKLQSPNNLSNKEAYHSFPIRVYYEDTDAGGVVYYANYLKFAERARTEYLRYIGVNHVNIKRVWGLQFVVKACGIDYMEPAVLDDELEIRTTAIGAKGATIILNQVVLNGKKELVKMEIKIVMVNCQTFRVSRIPNDIKQAFYRQK